ncbi:MAG: hypothetical protein AB7P02_09930 [Alphaproteobacteria bacterium]
MKNASRRLLLSAIALTAAASGAPAAAADCQGIARLQVAANSASPIRHMTFRLFNDSTTKMLTIGKVESPLIAMNPMTENFVLNPGRSTAYAFASTADLTAALPQYMAVYDRPASATPFEVAIQDCSQN